jgi:hypothetical protein
MSLEWEIYWIERIYKHDCARQGVWLVFSIASLKHSQFFSFVELKTVC